MRRSVLCSVHKRFTIAAVACLSSLTFTACEDGPAQTYGPAPAGAADNWNDGKNPPKIDPYARNPFGQDFGGVTAVDTCVGDVRRSKLAQAFKSPITPPTKVAGIDLRGVGGDADYSGLKIDDAFSADALCQGNTFFDPSDPQYGYTSWGDGQEVEARWDQTSRRIERIILQNGYTGALEFDGPDPADPNNFDPANMRRYHFVINEVPQWSRDGGKTWDNFTVKFDITTQKVDSKYVQALSNGMIMTFDPTQIATGPDGKPLDCGGSGRCLLAPDPTTRATTFGVRPVGMYIDFPNVDAPPEIASKPQDMFVTFLKLMPFSNAPMMLKLDADGPYARQEVGDLSPKKTCNLHLLVQQKDFLENCVNVFQSADSNQLDSRKWFGGIAHDDEHFFFNIQGVGLEFTSNSLPTFDILRDGTRPDDDDPSSAFQVDVRAGGPFLNDRIGPSLTTDFHGSAAVMWEYARLIQNDINKFLPAGVTKHQLGDPACLHTGVSVGLDWRPAPGCTGFEGIVTLNRPNTGNPQFDMLRQFDGPKTARVLAQNGNLGIGFRPGDPAILFCNDPLNLDDCTTGTIWDTSYKRVIRYLGNGEPQNVPYEMRDRRYFFKQWGLALVKYFRVAGSFGPDYNANVPIDLSDDTIYGLDRDGLFFDNVGDGDSERVEYVERKYVAPDKPPIDFEYEASVRDGNQRWTRFYQRLDRPEKAMYTAMEDEPDKPVAGKAHILLTDMFGSLVLRDYVSATLDGDAAAACFGGSGPCPTSASDGLGTTADHVIQLAQYKGAFTGTTFTIGNSLIKVNKFHPDIREAEVELPNFKDPYDTAKGTLDPIKVLVPWKPMLPGVGYFVPVTGQRDDFVTTAELDFSGITETFNLNFWYVDGNGERVNETEGNFALLKAVETSDFLGEVFLCMDPRTNDLLRTRMYDSANSIIEWLQNHPGAQEACNIIIRNSPYNNYPDYITSLQYGVRVGVNQGGGFGRINEAVIFQPQ